MIETKSRILDTAERLFAENGYAGTSLRSIIAAAEVNLAAVHYHFRSKEALLEAVVLRRAEPVNRERLELLDRCEREAGGAPSLEHILEAFLLPGFRIAGEHGGSVFVRLMGRVHAEGGVLPRVLIKHFAPMMRRFFDALRRAVPDVPTEELFWRMHFSIGAMSQALRGADELAAMSGGLCDPSDREAAAQRLVAFIAAGLRAPVAIPTGETTR
jgi:AcrR family transcriptional regulator